MTGLKLLSFLLTGDESMPQIKQCYSLLDRREDDVLFVKRSQSKSTSVAVAMTSPVTMTTAPSQAKVLPSVGVDPGCIVYISKPVAQTPSPGANAHPRAGYLLPVYKPDTREAAYAFLPAGAQFPHRAGDKAGLDTRMPDRKSNSYHTPVTSTSTHSHPLPHSTTGLKETHTVTASIPDKAKTIPHTQPLPSLYRDNTSCNTRVHSSYDSSSVTVTLSNPPRADLAHVNGGSASGSGKNHAVHVPQAHSQQQKASAYIGTSQISRPDLTNKSSVAPQDALHYPAACRTPEIVPNPTANTQEAIFNPMSLYVRARLVPKEVVTVNHGAEPSPPLVEYIKTDAICDKELTKWDAKNVADFIAATDCRDKAELFLEEVCTR